MARDPNIHTKWDLLHVNRNNAVAANMPPGVMLVNDHIAVDLIADMLLDPDWGVGMLEDIEIIVAATGRDRGNPFGVPTWDRH